MNKNNLKKWQGTAAVIGVDFGDSGKGRLIDNLSQNAHIVARFNGGSNTGHTINNHLGRFALHIVPSGIFNPKATCIVGRGVAVDLESLIEDEFVQLKKAGISWKNLLIDSEATLTMPWHKLRDTLREKYRNAKIGTTARGVGPTYADRAERVGLRAKDILTSDFGQKLKDELEFQNEFFKLKLSFSNIYKKYTNYAKTLRPLLTRTTPLVKEAIKDKKNILFEGAQGYFLDIDAGTYPFVTSSNTGILGIWRSFDLHPNQINQVTGISKAYLTRVGYGPMPSLIKGPQREWIIEKGAEIGTTSGRTRDPGWLDLVLTKEACKQNQVTSLAITKVDVLSGLDKIKICVGYKVEGKKQNFLSAEADYLAKCRPIYETLPGWKEDITGVRQFSKLPKNAQKYLNLVEDFTGVPLRFIGVGPERNQSIYV